MLWIILPLFIAVMLTTVAMLLPIIFKKMEGFFVDKTGMWYDESLWLTIFLTLVRGVCLITFVVSASIYISKILK